MLVQSLLRTSWRLLKKLNTELPYDIAILILGIHLEKIRIQEDARTLKFTAALFIVARHGSNLNVQQRTV